MRHVAATTVVSAVLLLACVPGRAEDARLRAAGPVGLGYVGMYYGLTDLNGSWYVGSDYFGFPSKTWMAVADTGGSACILGTTTQWAYKEWDGQGIPLQLYPDVKFTDEGFGGMVDFAVTEAVRLMIGDFRTVDVAPNPEDPDLYTAYGQVGGPQPPSVHLAAALEPIGGGDIDFEIIGMSVMQGRVLHVDPHYLQLLRLMLFVMGGSLEQTPPPPTHPRAMFIPVTMQDFFAEPQPVEVGEHPMLPVHIRHEADDPFATRTALFDTGSPVNFVTESFAVEAGIDLNSAPDLTIELIGLGPGQQERPGWCVDALALDLGNGREGDQLVITNTAVFTIPDGSMPGGLDAILGCGPFSPSMWFEDTPVLEWYVDTRDPDNAYIIVVPAKPGDANFDNNVDGADYTIWADNYQNAGTWTECDFSGDGFVDGADYTIWADNCDGGGTVPEPAGVAFLAVVAWMICRRRGRSRPGAAAQKESPPACVR